MFDHPHTGPREFAVGGPLPQTPNPFLFPRVRVMPSPSTERQLMDSHLRDMTAQRDRAVERVRAGDKLTRQRTAQRDEAIERAAAAEEKLEETRAALLDARKACKRLREERDTHFDAAERRLGRLRRLNTELNEARGETHAVRRQLDAANLQRSVAAAPRINLSDLFGTKPVIHPDAPARPTRPSPTDADIERSARIAMNEVWKAIGENAKGLNPSHAAQLLTALGTAAAAGKK